MIKRWDLEPYPGDQAPPHVHHRSDEAFCVLGGQLEVLIGDSRRILNEGDHVVVPAGTTHTFATVGEGTTRVLAVMTEEVDNLIQALHAATSDEERREAWARYNSSVIDPATS